MHPLELRRPLRLVQITDTHFCERPGDILSTGIDTDQSLRSVLDTLHYREHGCDEVIVTGDLAQDPVEGAYHRLRHALNAYPFGFRCLPGNHDDADLLFRSLARHPAPHAMLFLHHHPVSIGSPWIDRIALRNAEALFEVVDRHAPKVRAIVFGHVHQELEAERAGVRLIGTPATCIQFAPTTERLVVDDLPPAYRWLDLHADGRVETGVHYLDEQSLRATA